MAASTRTASLYKKIGSLMMGVLCLISTGCEKGLVKGSGKVMQYPLDVASVNELRLEGAIDLFLQYGDTPSSDMSIDDNLYPFMTYKVTGQSLEIGTKPGYLIEPSQPIRVRMVLPVLSKLSLTGANHATLKEATGAALSINAEGSNYVQGSGKVQNLTLQVSGVNQLALSELQSDQVGIRASGANRIQLFVDGQLDVHASGANRIEYKGSPSIHQRELSGTSTLSKMD